MLQAIMSQPVYTNFIYMQLFFICRIFFYVKQNINFSHKNTVSRTWIYHLFFEEKCWKLYITTPLFPEISVLAATSWWNVSIFVTTVETEKSFGHTQYRQTTVLAPPIANAVHFAAKPRWMNNSSLHPASFFVEEENGERRLEGEKRAEGYEGWLRRHKKSYIFSGYAKRIATHNEPFRGSFPTPESVSV